MTWPRIRFLALASVLCGLLFLGGVTASAESRWQAAGAQVPGETDRPVWSIAVSPLHPSVLLAATQGRGVLRSSDGGSSWTAVTPAVAGAWAVRFDPDHAGIAYAGTQSSGLLKSSDDGKTWAARNQGLEDLDIRAVDLSGDLVVLGTSRGMYYSRDTGVSWTSLGLGDLSIAAVGILPRAAGLTIFAGADNGPSSGGFLLRTQDLSASWTPVRGSVPPDAVVTALTVGPQPAGAGERPVLAGTVQGVFRSDDGGNAWTPVNGLPATDFTAVVFNPANADQIYAASDGDLAVSGVFRSLDRGNTWSPLGSGLPSRPRVTALALQPAAPPTVIAATWNPTSQQVGVYRIQDPSATVAGSPVTAAASPASAPQPVPSSGPSAVTAPRRIQSGAATLFRNITAVALGFVALGGVLWIRRWYRRREDQRTYQ